MTQKPSNSVTWDTFSAKFLAKTQLNFTALSAVQRIILTTDGTLTDILEAYLLEPINVVKLSENPLHLIGANPLNIDHDNQVIDRRILLQGKQSQTNWLYAESLIVTERLQNQFNTGLSVSNKPIGKLWNDYKMETFKETLCRFEEPAEELAHYFAVEASAVLLCRTYRVFSQKEPIMLITEKFPDSFYQG